jgi:hypothetical protein
MRILLTGLAVFGAVAAAGIWQQHAGAQPSDPLRPAADFASIADESARSVALFEEAGKVILHPRCVNCHPAGDRPLQGDEQRLHLPAVQRGEAGIGVPGLYCFTCHHEENFDPGGVPGAPNWHLAPIEMAWEGKTLGEVCEQIKDPERNGGMTLDALHHHMAEDELVAWGWHPGADREPAPGDQATFGELIAAWIETGAACPG